MIGNFYVYDDLFGILEMFWIKNEKKINLEKSGGKFFEISNEILLFIISSVSFDDVGEYWFIVINVVGLSISDVIVLGILVVYKIYIYGV